MRLLKTLLGLVFALSLGAAPFDFTCGNCHEAPAKVLPKKHPRQAAFTTCTACHGAKVAGLALKVHQQHLKDRELKPETCLECHPRAGGKVTLSASRGVAVEQSALPDLAENMASWLKSDKLGHLHMLKGNTCGTCHTTYTGDDDDTYNAKCKACHGDYDKMATVKTRFPDRNPHKAPHATMYPDMKCAACHRVHMEFKDNCSACHGVRFDWKPKAK